MNKSVSFIVRYLLAAMVLLAVNINSVSAELPKYSISSITNNSGLSHNTVYDICQDDKGFMWFATEGG
jgi:ligand-binding sensor domain-containing protein